MNLLLHPSSRDSDLTLINMKPENPASRLFFLLGKSESLLLHFKAFSPGAFGNSGSAGLCLGQGTPSLFSTFPLGLWKDPELLPIFSPSSWSPMGALQQLKCQDRFLEERWRCFALQLHMEQMNRQPKAQQSVHLTQLQLLANLLASFLQIPGFLFAALSQISFQLGGIRTFDILRKN